MLNEQLYLNTKLFNKKVAMQATRNGFGEGMVIAGEKNPNVMALCADLTESTRFHFFRDKFPERFVQIGVAEQNLMGVAAGLALSGKIPFIGSYATFSPGRNWDQIRVSGCYNNVNVKIVGAHAGLSVEHDGATHQALEDIAITRVLPNMTVIVPCDYHQSREAAVAAMKTNGPVYTRLARPKTPVLTTEKTPFTVGKAQTMYEAGDDVVIIGSGPILYECLLAAKVLQKEKIKVTVVNLHTIKPIDAKAIIKWAKRAKAMVVAEEHQMHGGVYSAVLEVLAKNYPIPVEQVAVPDHFGESGSHYELWEKFGLTEPFITKAVKKVLKRKK